MTEWPKSFADCKKTPWLSEGFEDPEKVIDWRERGSEQELLEWAATRPLWCLIRGEFRKAVSAFRKASGITSRAKAESILHAAVRDASRISVAPDGAVKVQLNVAKLVESIDPSGEIAQVGQLGDFSRAVARATEEIAFSLGRAYRMTEHEAKLLVQDAITTAVQVSATGESAELCVNRPALRQRLAARLGVDASDTAHGSAIDVLELRMTFEELRRMPQAVMRKLEERPGVYLITDRSDGKRYVGSAYGGGNIGGRWRGYGEGRWKENQGLRGRNAANFEFRVLELLDADATMQGVLRAETAWKKRLGTYIPDGLNAN